MFQPAGDGYGRSETVRGTAGHAVWLESANDWAELGNLQPGDLVRGRGGALIVSDVREVTEPQRVYNLEIHGEHVYEVTRLGLLTHNTSLPCNGSPDAIVKLEVPEPKAPVSAADRARQIHQAVPEATQNRTTIAVTETSEGIRVVSSSERRLRPAQRRLLEIDEIEGVGIGHAEITSISHARGAGLTPTGTAASRPICPNCSEFLRQNNILPLSPLK